MRHKLYGRGSATHIRIPEGGGWGRKGGKEGEERMRRIEKIHSSSKHACTICVLMHHGEEEGS